jgi:hypothetical protein
MKTRIVTCIAALAVSFAFLSTSNAADNGVEGLKVERPVREPQAQMRFNPKEMAIKKSVPWQSVKPAGWDPLKKVKVVSQG